MRIKRGTQVKQKHKRLLEAAKGYTGTRSRLVRRAKEAVLHSGVYAFHGRKLKKRDMRSLWIIRISEASKSLGIPYKSLIHGLKTKKIELNRKILADLVVSDINTFKNIVEQVKTKV